MASYVPLTLATGQTLWVNPETVDSVEDAAGVVPPASYVTFTAEGDETRITAAGTAAAVAAALASGGGAGSAASGTYSPALASAPVPPLANVFFSGDWSWVQVGNVVTVFGRFDFQLLFGGFAFLEVFVPPGPPPPTPGTTTGGGAVTARAPLPPGTQNNLGVTWKGIGPTGQLRFEVYDPTGASVVQPAQVELAVSYVVP